MTIEMELDDLFKTTLKKKVNVILPQGVIYEL